MRLLRTTVLVVAATATLAAAAAPDQLAVARRFYNQGQFDRALEAARLATANPATASSARLVMGRARLERYRLVPADEELDAARAELRAVDPRAVDARERVELQVGFAQLLFFEDRFGAAAEVLDPVLDASVALAPDSHERALEWWATALDRQAQSIAAMERGAIYFRITERMERELRRDISSAAASYWLAASARASSDLDRAWAAAEAGWIRAALGRDRGETLRTDLDRLVLQGIIPDRAARLPARDRRQAVAIMTLEWDAFKKRW
jgi:hypothetical protein